jgi:fructose-bisphosphate aldolase class 1
MSLEETARAIVAPGKGILAADESAPTIEKRFKSIDVESTERNRRDYREMLFRTQGVEEFISGVILFDETIRQNAAEGTRLVEVLENVGIIPGIKVDKGAKQLAGSPSEKVTEGLDGLRDRLGEYRGLGARFAKWRAVIAIGDGIPSDYCLDANAHALARYAALCVEAGIVPIVEPEVLMDGSHTIERCFDVTRRTLEKMFGELYAQRVPLEQILLKPNMVLSGVDCAQTRHRASERDEQAGRRSLGALVLLRPRAAGPPPQGLGRQCGQRRGGPEGLLPPREVQRRRAFGKLHGGDGAGRLSRAGAPLRPASRYPRAPLGPPESAARRRPDTAGGRSLPRSPAT